MSGAVDTKTVEMRFDNANFEKNAGQSISTLEKLKQALRLDGASAGLKEVEETSKKLDFKDLNKNIDGVGKHFSILEELAKGALRKIGESAAEQGMKIARSLTVDQLASGWNKYEQKVTAVQTIMANLRDEQVRFADEATKMDYVSGYLEKLIWFSDETSYSFTEMTSNLGKFIAVGQNLDESVTAIQGIATWAAMAGQRNAGAARAMYNISQALGVGAMTTIDWKSIENANMATAEFKETAIAAAVAMGKLKEGEVTIESFRESLQKKWFDKDVMMNVFQQYGAAAEKIQEYAINNNVNVQEAIRALKETDKDFAESLGFRAFAAAQEAKTFGEVVEATADAVSSKWLKIFENIFGNYQEAKELWTDFSEQLWEVLAQPLDVLNDIMSKWNRGFFADGPKNIIEKWFESGKLDDLNNGLEYVTEEVAKLAVTSDSATYKIITLSDGTKRLTKTVKDASGKIKTYYKNIFSPGKDLVNGRTVLLQSFQNIFDTLFHDVYDKNDRLEHMSFFGAMKRGLQEVVFGTSTVERIIPKASKKMWELTNSFKEFTEKLKPSLETSHKIKNIFKGLFTTIKIGIKFVKSAIKPFTDLFSGIFARKEGERGLLDLANSMSRWVQNLDRFLERNKIYERVTEGVSSGLDKIKSGVDSLVKAWTGLSSEEYIKKLKDDVFKFFENYDFRAAFNKVVDPIRSFIEQIRQFKTGELPEELTPLQKFLTGFTKVYRKIKQFFGNAIAVLGSIGEKVGTIFRSIIDAFKNFAKQIKQVASGELPEELTPLQKFLLAIGSVFKFFKETYEKLSMKFPEIINRIKSFKLSDFKQLITPIQNFLASTKTSISSLIDGAFGRKSADDMSKSAKRFAPVIRAFASIFEGLGNLFESAGPYIEKIGKAIGELLTNLGANLDKFVGNKSGLEVLESVVKIFTDFANGKFLLSLAKIDNRFAKLIKVFTKQVPLTMQSIRDIFKGTTDGVNGFFKTLLNHLIGKDRKTVGKAVIEDLEAIKGILTAYKREINAGALIDVALAIGALAASMWVLAQIPSEKLISSGNALAQIAVVVVGLYAAMTAIASIKSYLQDKKTEKGQTIFDSLKAILTSTVKSSIFANDATAKFLKFAAGVFLIAVAIKKVSSCMEEISTGIIAVGKAYSNPKFKDGLKALGFLAAGLALTSLVSSLGRGGLLRTIGVFVVFLLFIKSAKGVIDKISEIGKTTDSASFYKGLEYVAVLLGGLTILSLVASIGRAGSKFVGFIGMLGAMLAMAIFVKSIAKALTGLASVAKDGNLDAAASAILSLMQPIMAFILLTSLLSRSKKGRKATTRAMLALLAGALAIRLIASSLIKIAKVNDTDKINAAAKLIQSIGLAVGITLGVLSILGGLSVNKMGFQFNGKTGILRAALSFVGICYGITLMANAIKEMAAIGDTTSINFYRAIVQSLTQTIGWTIGLLGALAGLNAGVKTGVANVKYNGMIGVPVAALSFVGICYGITLMTNAIKEIASIGDAGAAQKAADIIESLATVVGVITGSLGAEAGLNFFATFGAGGVLFSGTLGALAAAVSFVITCNAVSVMAGAVKTLATAGSVKDAEKAKDILKSLSWVVYGVLALLGAEAGLDGWATIGAAGIAFLGTLGVPMAAFSFLVACRAIGEMAKAVSGIASSDTASMDKAKDVLKSLSWVVYGVLALLGAEAGLDGWATIGAAGIAFLGTLGVPMAAFSFLVACRAVESIAKAVKEIASIGVTEIQEAESVIEGLTEVIGKVTGLLGAESSLDAYVNTGVIGVSFSGSSGIPTAAASFWAVTEGVKSMAEAVKTISDIGNLGSIRAGALSVIRELTGVVTDILDISVKQWFTSDEMKGRALSFATVATSIKNLAESIKVLTAGGFLTSEEGSGEGVGEQLKTIIASAISGVIDAINEGQIEVSTAADSLAYAVELPITSLDAETWGKDLGSNLASGMLAMVPTVRSAAEALAAAIRAILGFSEPKEGPLSDFHTYAPDMIKLWNKGVYSNLGSIEASTTSIADTMYDGFSTALDYVSGLIDNGMSDQLTIRPVMDLSEIQNGVNSINGMLSTPPTYMVTGSSRLAAAAAYGMGAMNSVAPDQQATITDIGPTTNNFYISGADPDAIADRISKLLAQKTRRQKATWAKSK